MRKQSLFICAAVMLGLLSTAGFADDGEAFVSGTQKVGAHSTNYTGNPVRVGEYVNLEDTKSVMADLYMSLFGGTEDALFNVGLQYMDTSTNSFNFNLKTNKYLTVDLAYDSFVHNLDHDLLTNLQALEANPDGAGGWNPGGKQVYHTDNDPGRMYYLEYKKFHGNLAMQLPGIENGEISLGYAEQRKTGYKQTLTIDHCAVCHVEGHTQRIDQQTDTWSAGAQGTFGKVSLNYGFKRQEYVDLAANPSRRWKNAMHPVHGNIDNRPDNNSNYGVEFGSRVIFEDVTRGYGHSADTEKTSHSAGLKMDLEDNGTVKASYTYTKNRNYHKGIENKFNAGAFGYAVKLNREMRLTTKFLAYEAKVDDWFIDLPNFRFDRPGGDLDFDWTRISSANRKVYQFDANLYWKLAKERSLKLNWRTQVIDRPAMAQNQTSYLFDEAGAVAEKIESVGYENKTTINRLKLRYDAKMGMKGRYNLTYAMTMVDKPFMNPTAMCEESLAGANNPGNTGRIYYYQRERYGMGTNQPNQAHKLTLRGSYQLSARSAFNAFLTYAKDKNDDLKIYEFERDMFTPGFNFWTAPTDRLLFTLGWTHNTVKSNANLCIPIFDG
jgi:hypothetical protein